jgi:SpoIID/LytB domain protein
MRIGHTLRPGAPRRVVGLVGVLAVLAGVLSVPLAVVRTADATAGPLVIDGRGNGHGIGMSQWGAYGYAADRGWSAGQILDHYYGGTVAGTTDVATMTVRLMRLDDQQTAVVNDRGLLVVDGVAGGPWGSVVARETAPRSYSVWARADMACPAASDSLASGWTLVASGLPAVTIRPQTDTSSSTDHRDLVSVCESTGTVRTYRGSIQALNGTAGENRTVNEVPLELYLRPIVASEMSPSWATKGAQALQAQVIAARTYAIAEKRYSYAKTCDLVCQFYPGVLTRQGVSGSIKRIEYPSTDAAVAATTGVVRRVGSPTGPVAYAMFSSSSGGWTAASSLGFPPVEDLGDATASNPFHRWTVEVPATTVTAAWPSIGQYVRVVVNRRSGQGEWGGRVQSVTVVGTAGSVTLTGDTFRRAIGLRSDWFAVRGEPVLAPPTTSAGPVSPVSCARTDAVRSGDSWWKIAVRNGMTMPDLLEVNNATTSTALWPGMRVCLAANGGGATTTLPPTTLPPSTTTPTTTTTLPTLPPTTTTTLPPTLPPTTTVPPISSACDGRDAPPVVGAASTAAPAGFTPITPQRLIDTRNGTGTTARALRAGCTLVVRAPVPAGATAAAVNLIAVGATGNGYLTVYACGTPRPFASAVQSIPGGVASGSAFVPLAPDGSFCVFSSLTSHVVVDLFGWFTPGGGDRFEPITTSRRYDSRTLRRQVPAWTVVRVGTRGAGGAPAGSTGASLVVHAIDAAADAHVTVWPCDVAMPEVSSLNVGRRGSVTNAVDVRVSAAGEVCLSASATVHLVVDLAGWYGPGATTTYHAVPASRVADTRVGMPWIGALSRNSQRRLDVTGVAGVPASGVRAIAAQVTAVEGTQAGYVTVHPCLPRTPDVSMLRYQIRRNTAAPVRAAVSTTGDWCFVTNGSAHVVVDVSGWFG